MPEVRQGVSCNSISYAFLEPLQPSPVALRFRPSSPRPVLQESTQFLPSTLGSESHSPVQK